MGIRELLIGGAILLGLRALSKGTAVNQLDYEVAGIKPDFNNILTFLTSPTATLKTNILNPTEQTFTFENFSGRVSYKGRKLATITTSKAATIQPRGKTRINFGFRFDGLESVWTIISASIKNGEKVTVDGVMEFKGGLVLPIKTEVSMTDSEPYL